MEQLSRQRIRSEQIYPERVIQFGEGNFLRGFIDWMLQRMNNKGLFNGSVVAIQPTPSGKVLPKLEEQDYLYTVVLRGVEQGSTIDQEEIISSIHRGINPYTNWAAVLALAENPSLRYIFSNTTEAGLTYKKEVYREGIAPMSYPGKLAVLLYARYRLFSGSLDAGFHIFPCELVEENGAVLQSLVLQASHDFRFPEAFRLWVKTANVFYNTLVDRIVTGYPDESIASFQERLQYRDALLTVGEPYHLFVIEGQQNLEHELPFQEAGLNVHWAAVKPFRDLKVRILNGLHTVMYAMGYLLGLETVKEAMEDPLLEPLIHHCLYEEILPVLPMEDEEKETYAKSVVQRFVNPFNHHRLADLGLNGLSKFKVRVLPTLLDYVEQKKKVPDVLVFALVTNLLYFRVVHREGEAMYGQTDKSIYRLKESEAWLEFLEATWKMYDSSQHSLAHMVATILGNEALWGQNLMQIPQLHQAVLRDLTRLIEDGIKKTLKNDLF
ncbi:altronate oxidoreductase [Pullulanibacillus camelliae]|uniref:Altronate oxidoreductase n=1 Tax=Pullulanibacillus camelliae TaxID=1707096 RepID=A0A8J2VCN4_9BACL|nr:tagaturonate reductase [Pullulanibacillus camelliae]GGE26563.1 altronate oxidoreductase [Pullulanibacillus camelliae]